MSFDNFDITESSYLYFSFGDSQNVDHSFRQAPSVQIIMVALRLYVRIITFICSHNYVYMFA